MPNYNQSQPHKTELANIFFTNNHICLHFSCFHSNTKSTKEQKQKQYYQVNVLSVLQASLVTDLKNAV